MQSLSQRIREEKLKAIEYYMEELLGYMPKGGYRKIAEGIMASIEQVELEFEDAEYEARLANQEDYPRLF